MIHNYTSTSFGSTGRIVVQSAYPLDVNNRPDIQRVYQSEDGSAKANSGVIVTPEAGGHCALVIMVKPYDLVEIIEFEGVDAIRHAFCYKVGQSFDLTQADLYGDKLTDSRLSELIGDTTPGPMAQLNSDPTAITMLIEEKHPEWLVEVIDKQIEYWRQNEPEHLWRFAPGRVKDEEICEVVTQHPYLALANFQDRLTRKQLLDCVKRSDEGAIRFAFEAMNEDEIIYAINIYSNDLLEYAANKLSDEHFGICVSMNPYSAFEFRHKMTPDRKAVVLCSLLFDRCDILDNFGEDTLGTEILDSLKSHAEIWCRACNGDGLELFETLDGCGVKINYNHWEELQRLLPEELKPGLNKYIASRI